MHLFPNHSFAKECEKHVNNARDSKAGLPFASEQIVVVGGSKGIGFGIAKRCTELGAKVCIVARSAESVSSQLSPKAGYVSADFGTIQGIKDAAANIESKYKNTRIDHLVLCAGEPINGRFELNSEKVNKHYVLQCLQRYYLASRLAPIVNKGILIVCAPYTDKAEPSVEQIKNTYTDRSGFMSMNFVQRMLAQKSADSSVIDATAMYLHKKYPALYMAHVFPGLVNTTAAQTSKMLPGPMTSFYGLIQPLVAVDAHTFANVPVKLMLTAEKNSFYHVNQRLEEIKVHPMFNKEADVAKIVDYTESFFSRG